MDVTDLREQLERHHPVSFGWALTCCRQDAAEAADVLQMAYLKILNGRAVFDGRASFKTWLFGVIRNTAADERRRHWLRLLRSGDYFREQTCTSEPAVVNGGEEESELMKALRRALEGLPTRQREVLHLVFYQGLTIQEASSVLNVSVGSARTHYERGKGRLREKLTPSSYHHENHRNGPRVPTTL
jgi:RNA polymerase sigma-70 factor (ECF subfamily)